MECYFEGVLPEASVELPLLLPPPLLAPRRGLSCLLPRLSEAFPSFCTRALSLSHHSWNACSAWMSARLRFSPPPCAMIFSACCMDWMSAMLRFTGEDDTRTGSG